MDNHAHSSQSGQLVSTSTILILSGFLLGMAVSSPLDDLSFYVTMCGLCGVVSYLALELAAVRRLQGEVAREQAQMERRLERHVNSTIPFNRDELSERTRLLEWLKRETEHLV
jgi:hypothetical protein